MMTKEQREKLYAYRIEQRSQEQARAEAQRQGWQRAETPLAVQERWRRCKALRGGETEALERDGGSQ